MRSFLRVDDREARYPIDVDPLLWVWRTSSQASDGQPGDDYGASVDMSGDTIIVGAIRDSDIASNSGSAYFYERTERPGQRRRRSTHQTPPQVTSSGRMWPWTATSQLLASTPPLARAQRMSSPEAVAYGAKTPSSNREVPTLDSASTSVVRRSS